MSTFYVSGPAESWVGPVNTALTAANALFIGFSRAGITVQITPQWEDVEVDYAGRMPGDEAMLGQEASISGTFVRYNEGNINNLLNFAQVSNAVPGFGPNFSVGTLLQTEGYWYQLLVYSPYGFKSAYGTMTPGFLFASVYLSNPYDVTLSIRHKAPNLSWRAVPRFGTGANASAFTVGPPYNAYSLYSNTMPSPMPTPD